MLILLYHTNIDFRVRFINNFIIFAEVWNDKNDLQNKIQKSNSILVSY